MIIEFIIFKTVKKLTGIFKSFVKFAGKALKLFGNAVFW